MTKKHTLPLIGLPACVKDIEERYFHAAAEQFIRPVIEHMNAIPVVLPALGKRYDYEALFEKLDGILLTGSPSNVEPHLYGATLENPNSLKDPQRDETTFALIHHAIEHGVPLLGICRGLQEMNAALGGTLHQDLRRTTSFAHHSDEESIERCFSHYHPVKLIKNTPLHQIIGEEEISICSVHLQGINKLSDRLEANAIAPDGLIEAAHVKDATSFAIGVQWHPEWEYEKKPHALKLFSAFSDAVRRKKAT